MKSLVLFLSAMFPFVLNGQTYFTEGTEWKMQVSGTHESTPVTSTDIVTLEKCMDGDEQSLGMYLHNSSTAGEREFVAFIKTEGDKVFFKRDEGTASTWYLMYDFGMVPGESGYFYSADWLTSDGTPHMAYLKCVGVDEEQGYDGWSTLSLEEYNDESCDIMLGRGVWLRRLSAATGVLKNIHFEVDGAGSTLLEASCNGNVIYKNGTAGITLTSSKTSFNIKIDGLDVLISGADAHGKGYLYSEDGQLLRDFNTGNGSIRLNLPKKGAYILKIGDVTKKIFGS